MNVLLNTVLPNERYNFRLARQYIMSIKTREMRSIMGRARAGYGGSQSSLVTAYSAKTRRFQTALESECE